MSSLAPLPQVILEPIVRGALLEDLGRAGDITSDAIIPVDCKATLALNARQAGVVAGLDLVMFACWSILGSACSCAARRAERFRREKPLHL